MTDREDQFGYHSSPDCSDICYLAQQVERADQFRVYRRRKSGIRSGQKNVGDAKRPAIRLNPAEIRLEFLVAPRLRFASA